VIDGICGDLTFEEGGNPVEANRIIAGRDPLLLDSYCAELIGYKPDEIEYLVYGKEWGLGEFYSPETEIVELNAGDKPVRNASADLTADRFKNIINEDAACSACYSSLVFALHKSRGETVAKGKISIGQGFKSKTGDGIGIGSCARGFAKHVPGCPPKATDIIRILSR